MIAYNKTAIDNATIHDEADNALHENLLPTAEADAIKTAYPVSLYSPNIFIRIGLFVLTIIIGLFSFGLLVLICLNSIENIVTGLAICFALLLYAALEYFVQTKKHYRSGVDDALLWGAAGTLFCAIYFRWITTGDNLAICVLVFCISLYATLRFADWLMAALAVASLFGIFFFCIIKMGSTGKTIVPFMMMTIAATAYFLAKKKEQLNLLRYYTGCLAVIEIIALLAFYAAGNYFVVRELSNEIFGLGLITGQSIPFGWLFWILTIVVPLIYIYRGVKKKNAILIRTGLLLVAAIVFTIRYYHTVLSAEMAMTIGGAVLIILAWALIKYLRQPKYGFTYLEQRSHNGAGKLNIESLIIAETFSQQPGEGNKTTFGGGSYGGGGASGEY